MEGQRQTDDDDEREGDREDDEERRRRDEANIAEQAKLMKTNSDDVSGGRSVK